MLPHKLTQLTYQLTLGFLRFDGITATTTTIQQHPTQKSLNRAVKGVCASSPEGMKDVEGDE